MGIVDLLAAGRGGIRIKRDVKVSPADPRVISGSACKTFKCCDENRRRVKTLCFSENLPSLTS